jgi:hypothetical protein
MLYVHIHPAISCKMEFVSPYCLIAGVFKPSSSSSPSSTLTLKYQYFLRGVSLEISFDKLK